MGLFESVGANTDTGTLKLKSSADQSKTGNDLAIYSLLETVLIASYTLPKNYRTQYRIIHSWSQWRKMFHHYSLRHWE